MGSGYKWKVVLVGDFAVGKTSLVRRYVYDEFSDSYLTTIGVKVTKKEVLINDTASADLLLWDIAGSDKFNKISPDYIKGASAGIIVADLTRKNTVENISVHEELLYGVNPDILIYVALNKSDLSDKSGEMLKLAEKILERCKPGQIMLTSAKDNLNIEKLFNNMSHELYGRYLK